MHKISHAKKVLTGESVNFILITFFELINSYEIHKSVK